MVAFRRLADPFVMTVSTASQTTQIPIAGQPQFPSVGQGRSFRFINKTPYYVRLRGSQAPTFVPVTTTTGWCFAPGTTEVYASQLPTWVSVMIEATAEATPPNGYTGTVELSYGTGA